MESSGAFTARVYSSNALIPIPDAYVTVTRKTKNGGQELVAYLKTDRNGLTKTFMLDAPSADNSLVPGNNGNSFASYDVFVHHPLYYTTDVKNVQVFGGNGSTLPFELIPVPEDKNPAGKVERVDITPQNL